MINLNMPINIFGNYSNNSEHKIDTGFFVQKPCLRIIYIGTNLAEDSNMKNQYKIKNLPCPHKNSDADSKSYVDNLFNDSILIKNTEQKDLKVRNITNARFIRVNQLPQIDSLLTAKLHVDDSIDEPSLVRNNQDNDFTNHNLNNINSITLNTQAVNVSQVITKTYVDQFHQESDKSRRDLALDFCDESNYLVKNIQKNDLNDKKINKFRFYHN